MSQPNMRLIVDNRHDLASLTATSEALPVTYTQRSERVRAWRSVGTAEQVITATLPSPTFLEGLVIYRHNLSSASRVQLELLNGEDVVHDTGPVNISGLIPLGEFRFGVDPWGATTTDSLPVRQAPFWFLTTLCTGYRLTLTDPNNPDGYMQVGRIIAGDVLSPTYNPSYGLNLQWEDVGEHRRTEGMSLRTVGEGLSRRLPVALDFVDKQDRQKFTNAFLRSGKSRDIYITVFPEEGSVDEAEYAFMARRETHYGHTHDFYNNWQIPITFVEI